MNELLKLVSNYIDGKPTFPAIRRILNVLFNLCISFFFLELYLGQQEWFSILDYKKIIDFFVRGYFFIPLVIYVAVHYSIVFIAMIFFEFLGFFYSKKMQSKILNVEYNPGEISQTISKVQDVSKMVVPVELTPKIIEKVYQEIKKTKPEVVIEIELKIKEQKRVIELNFYLIFRAIITLVVLKITLQEFGNVFFGLTFMLSIGCLFLLKIAYWFLDIAPTIARKYLSIADSYFAIKLLNEEGE